jgi:PqqD family protein of HPr-rel-A system
MAEDPVLLWQLADPGRTRVARFDDDALVFNPVSWETHLVRLPALLVIEALAGGAQREADLAAGLLDEDDRASDLEALRALLEELESLGLLSRRPEAR